MNYRELFYISNILSLSRVFLVVPLYFCLRAQTTTGDYLATAVMFGAAATDFFDGRLARKLNQRSDLGRVLDPIADKICVAVTAFLLIEMRDLPLWYFAILIARDLGILLLGSVLVLNTKVMVESNWIGKLAVSIVALVLVAFTLQLDGLKWPLLWGSVALLAVSTVSYFVKMIKLLQESRQHA